jgi:copper transport protein
VNGAVLLKKRFFCWILLFILLIIQTTPVEAHSSLEKTFPNGNEVLEKSPSTIEVWFQDPVVIHADSLKVLDSKGNQISTTKTVMDQKDSGHIITNLEKELAPGIYTVKVNVLALDGFVIKEEFRFSLNESVSKSQHKEFKLVKSSLKDGEIYTGSPKQLELWFNQPADLTAIGVFDDHQKVIGTKEPVIDSNDPRHVIIPFTEELSSGSYQVSWYASPVDKEMQTLQNMKLGVFYFAVDKFSSIQPGGEQADRFQWSSFGVSFGLKQISYWLSFIGLTILFGLSWFYSVILKNRVEQNQLNKTSFVFYLISVIGTILLLVHHKLDLTELSFNDFMLLKFTWIPIAQLVLITLGLWFKKIRPFLYGMALLLWPFVIGHASYPRYGGYLTMGTALLHVLAVAIWMGGLFAIIAKPKQKDSKDWLKAVGPSFSKWAFLSVVIIILTGIWMTVQFLPSFSLESLVRSEWGRSLLAKTVLFLLIVIIGYVQRKAVKQLSSKLVHSFSSGIRTELIYGVIIFFFAASLVAANPSAAEQGVYPKQTAQQDLNLNVEITPFKMGLNTITLKFQDHSDIRNVRVELRMPPDWKIENNAFKVDKGTYKLTGNLLHAAGTVNMKVKVVMQSGEEIKLPYKIVVPGEIRFNEF